MFLSENGTFIVSVVKKRDSVGGKKERFVIVFRRCVKRWDVQPAWPDVNFFIIWLFTTKNVSPKANKICQVPLKLRQIPNKHSKCCQISLNFGQNGEISPNLVTLVRYQLSRGGTKSSFFILKSTQTLERNLKRNSKQNLKIKIGKREREKEILPFAFSESDDPTSKIRP